MEAYRPDRVVRVLTAVVTVAYYALWVGVVLALVAAPLAKLFAGDDPSWTWGVTVPARVDDAEGTVRTGWGAAQLVVREARAEMRVPIAQLPWWLLGVLWLHVAMASALMLSSLHHLRRIFQRVRGGAPFDADNALRMRWVGLLLLGLALFEAVVELVTSLAVRGGLAEGDIGVATRLYIDPSLVFVALVLVALAEIFRRGAELEDEQSLVV